MTIPLSYSKYNVYNNCPLQFKAKYIDKVYPDESDNPHFIRGSEIHKQCENAAKAIINGKDLPPMNSTAVNAVPIIQKLRKRFTTIVPEKQIAVDKNWRESSWFDNSTAFYRIILDLTCYNETECVVIDWKTGKVRDYDGKGGQLHLGAAILFNLIPSLQNITAAFLFLEHKHTISVSFTRDELPDLTSYFENLHANINADKDLKPTPHKYCYFCKLTSEYCVYKKD